MRGGLDPPGLRGILPWLSQAGGWHYLEGGKGCFSLKEISYTALLGRSQPDQRDHFYSWGQISDRETPLPFGLLFFFLSWNEVYCLSIKCLTMCVFMYLHMCTYMCTQRHMHVHVCLFVLCGAHMCTCVFMHVCLCVCFMRMCASTCVMCMCISVCLCVNVCVFIHVLCVCVYVFAYVCEDVYICVFVCMQCLCSYMYLCVMCLS